MAKEFMDKIDKIGKVEKELKPEPTKRIADKEHFDALMDKGVSTKEAVVSTKEAEADKKTLFDEAKQMSRKVDYSKNPNASDLIAQAEDALKRIDEIKVNLERPELKLKNSTQTVLRDHLSHIDESLRIALTKAGLEYGEPDLSAGRKPLDRFLSMLTHGQNELQNLTKHINEVHLSKKELSPTSMLMIQIKVNAIQQELELFANMLNKSLESIKTVMNVQV